MRLSFFVNIAFFCGPRGAEQGKPVRIRRRRSAVYAALRHSHCSCRVRRRRGGHPHEPEDLQESMKSAGRGTPNDLTNLHMGELRPYKEVVP